MKILFVCLGNICRSPMAEGMMKHLAAEHHLDWEIDSAGTEYYHVGQNPDHRAIAHCKDFGIDISQQQARLITGNDLKHFDLIYALAENVRQEITEEFRHNSDLKKVKLLMDEVHPGKKMSVPDPWYGTQKDFDIAFRLIREACEAIVRHYAVLKTIE